MKVNLSYIPEKTYSDYGKLVRLTAWWVKYLDWLKLKVEVKRANNSVSLADFNTTLTLSEFSRARQYWWRVVQREQFGEELNCLENGKRVPASSSILRLRPILKDGLIRAEGRLRFSTLSDNEKLPIIVKASHWVVELYIKKAHQLVLHSGVNESLMLTRKNIWILHGRREVKKVVDRCTNCKKAVSKPLTQIEAPLPQARVTEAGPFDVVGVDFFGHMMVKSGNSCEKVYGLIITCAVTRAVHLELTSGLRSSDFIMAFERFSSRRGTPGLVYSDNAKTFKSASKELSGSSGIDCNDLRNYFQSKTIEWRFIVDRAPWWGGFWERLIRNVKLLLKKNFRKVFLTYDELRTVLVQIEGVVNSRPITYVYSEVNEPEPLTPNDLLLGRRSTVIPSLNNVGEVASTRSELVGLANHKKLIVYNFWKRWHHEYLNELRRSTENKRVQESFPEVGQVCLVVEDNVPRSFWKLAVIIELHPGIDGVVRAVTLRTKSGTIKRPVQRLVLLEVCASGPVSSETEVAHPHSPVCAPPIGTSEGGEDVAVPDHAASAVGHAESGPSVQTRMGRTVRRPLRLYDYDLG